MKFEEAFVQYRKGKRIRRNSKEFITILYLKDSCITNEDLFAEDWEVIEEPGKTFDQVFEAFKEGKYIRRKSWINHTILCARWKVSIDEFIHTADLLATDWEIIE